MPGASLIYVKVFSTTQTRDRDLCEYQRRLLKRLDW